MIKGRDVYMAMVKNKKKYTYNTKIRIKNKKINSKIKLNIKYSKIDPRDVYGFYLTNKTTKNNSKCLPDIGSFVDVYPDFIALESEPGLFNKTLFTCVSWFKHDQYFDTIDGLYNAIIYKDEELLKFYKTRYLNVKMFIGVDYSTYGDFDEETLLHNIKKSCVVFLWLTFELNGLVYPLMTYGTEKSFNWCFEHIMKGSNVAISLKGVMKGQERKLFLKALKVLIDTRSPKALIVYTVASKESSDEMLKYAKEKGVPIIYAANTLLDRNCGDFYNG